MRLSSVSVRYPAIFFIGLMGVAALGLVIATALAYRHFSWQSHEHAFQRLAEFEVGDVLDALGQNSADLAIRIQHDQSFKQQWQDKNWAGIVAELNDQFNQYYFTAGIIPITKLQVYDLSFNLLAESTGGSNGLSPGIPVCSQLIDSARQRKGAERLKTMSHLCLMSGKPQYATLAPVGGLLIKGYILVASDPAPVLEHLESGLGMPITITDAGGRQRYVSPPDRYQKEGFYLPVTYQILTEDKKQAYRVSIDVDMTSFDQHTQKVFYYVLVLAIIVTLLIVLLAIIVMRNTIVLPLEELSKHLSKIRNDSSLLEKPIAAEGNKEVHALASAFNLMSNELSLMQKRLTDMAYTDSLTGAANRLRFNNFLETHTGETRRTNDMGFALFVIDLDKFKAVNDLYGHDAGDYLLLTVVERMQEVVRESDMIARLGGDEFAVILPGMTDKDDVSRLAEKLIRVVGEPVIYKEAELIPGLSVGISLFPETTSMLKALIKSADHAMYRAKESGGGYVIAEQCPKDCDNCLGDED